MNMCVMFHWTSFTKLTYIASREVGVNGQWTDNGRPTGRMTINAVKRNTEKILKIKVYKCENVIAVVAVAYIITMWRQGSFVSL